jgi:hypothetical protein
LTQGFFAIIRAGVKMKNFFKNYYHKLALLFWILMIPPTLLFWKNSVLWVAVMSLYANIWLSLNVILSEEKK